MLKRKISLKANTIFLTSFVFLTSLLSVESNALSTYYIRTLFDEGTFGMVSQVIPDKSDGTDNLETSDGVDFSGIADYRKVYKGGDGTPGSSLIVNVVKNDPVTSAETYKEVTDGSAKDMGLVFSFPGLTSAKFPETKYTALSSDSARAELVANTLTKGMNDALMFIKTYSGAEHISGEGLRLITSQLARITAPFEHAGGSGTFNTGKANGGKGFSVIQITGPTQKLDGMSKTVGEELVPVSGLKYPDYVFISTTNSSGKIVYGYFPWRMAKGYHEDQILSSLVGSEYTDVAKTKENRYVTWGQMVIQAGVNADIKSKSAVDSAEDTMTLIGQGLGADLTSMISSVRSMLNLAPMQELVLNMNSRTATHYMGAMTQEMYSTAKSMYALVFAVSLLGLSAIIIHTIQQKMLSTANVVAKISFMEKIQDLIFVAVALAFFPAIFELMLEINYWIVKTFAFSNDYMQAYGILGQKAVNSQTLAGFMISTIFLSIDAYINMTYLVRSLILAFLFCISPLVTIIYPLSPTQKKMYFSYIREVIGTIFMQSFHAITMCFFASYNSTNMSALEAIVSAYCFIPVTQMFRQFVIGNQGFSESIGGKLAGQLVNTASGMHKSNIAMKQSKDMMDLQANSAKTLADAGFKSQMTAFGSDMLAMGANSMISNSEIGNNMISKASGAMKNSSNGLVSGLGNKMGSPSGSSAVKSLASAGATAGIGLLGAKAGADTIQNAQADVNKNMGEMQMKHSMENIGTGLAQTGIGLGVSSFDSGVGNSMINGGMNSIQAGASEYGKGASNEGAGGALLAQAEGTKAKTGYARDAIYRTAMTSDRNYNNFAKERQGARAEESKFDSRGLDSKDSPSMNMASNALNMQSTSKDGLFSESLPSPIVEMKRHENNNNNVTAKIEVSKLNNASGNDAIMDYLQKFKQHQGDLTKPVLAQAQEKAEKAGMNMSVGNGTGIAGNIQSDKNVGIIINNIGRYGIEVDGAGNALKSTSNLNIGSTKK